MPSESNAHEIDFRKITHLVAVQMERMQPRVPVVDCYLDVVHVVKRDGMSLSSIDPGVRGV